MTKNTEELNTSPERVQKTPVNEHELPVVAYRFNYDGYGWDYRDEGTGSSWLLGMTRNGGEPLTTIAAANEAIEQAKLRPAPCARYCEAQAFTIEIRDKDRRIAELEESIGQRDSYIKSLERLFDSTFIAGQDKNLQRIAELEAVLQQARDVIKSECGFGGENIYDPWAIVAAIDALGEK